VGVSIEMSPQTSPSASPAPSPGPSPSPSPARGALRSTTSSPTPSPSSPPPAAPGTVSPSTSPPVRPSPARPGMLVRAKSANAVVFNSSRSTDASDATDTGGDANEAATAAGDGVTSPPRKARFLSRLSMAITGSNAAALTEAAQAADRQRTDAVMSRSLIKHRNRSIFGAFRKTTKADDPPVDESGEIINELSRESLAWEGGNQETGQWRKRVQQEQEQRRAAGKKRSAKIVSKIKSTKKMKKNSKKIAQVVVVFPLPVKDPLLAHRKLYDFSHAYNIRGEGDIER
jgi:hypothetical protein